MKGNKRIAIVVLLMVVCAALILGGCGKDKAPETLEEYVATAEGGQDILKNTMADDPNAEVTIEGNTMVFTYTVEDEEITAEALEGGLDSLGDAFAGIIKDLETKTELENISVKVVYVDGSGEEITSKLFE